MRKPLSLLLLLALAGCSKPYENKEVGFRYLPPKGFAAHSESPGYAELRSGSGARLTIARAPALPVPTDRDATAAWEEVVKGSPLPLPEVRLSIARNGSIPAGPVFRYEFKQAGEEHVLYVVMKPDRAVYLHLAGGSAKEQRDLDSSLGKLELF